MSRPPTPRSSSLPLRAALAGLALSGSALADHIPPAGLDYKGTWIVLIAVGVVFSLLILAAIWAYLDGQFGSESESVKYKLLEPDGEWPYGRGTSLERP